MRFDKRTGPVPFLNRRDQNRMLALCGGLVMVIVLIQLVSRPQAWGWFFALTGESEVADTALTISPEDEPLVPEAIKFQEHPPLPGEDIYASVEKPETNLDNTTGENSGDTETKPDLELTALNQLPPELLVGLEDNWLGLTSKGKQALERILAHTATLPAGELPAVSRKQTPYSVIYNDPDKFRGELLHIEGRLVRLQPFDNRAFGNLNDPLDAWEAWIVSPDTRGGLWMLLLPSKPEGFEDATAISTNSKVKVSTEAYFVQRFAYPTDRASEVTLQLVAPTLSRLPAGPDEVAQADEAAFRTSLLFAGGIVLVIGVLFFWFVRTNKTIHGTHLGEIADARFEANSAELESLKELDGGDPHKIQIDDPDEETN